MIKRFVDNWEKYKNDLENYFRTTPQVEYNTYRKILEALFRIVINRDDSYSFDLDDITVIDSGEYQGSLIFILHLDTYQPIPTEHLYTFVYYGSCSCCDTLKGIHEYDEGLPDEKQIREYMFLAVHMLQKCKFLE